MNDEAMSMLNKLLGMRIPSVKERAKLRGEITEKVNATFNSDERYAKVLETSKKMLAEDDDIEKADLICLDPEVINARLVRLQDGVREWAFRNFGGLDGNESKLTRYPLGNLSSLLGIVEETGEYAEAYYKPEEIDPCRVNGKPTEDNDSVDAVADAIIFMLDFCNRTPFSLYVTVDDIRESLRIQVLNSEFREAGLAGIEPKDCPAAMAIYVGRLAHVVLKANQGIRGFDDPEKYRKEVFKCVKDLFMFLMRMTGYRLLTYVEKVWEKVQKRDWEKNKLNAHEEATTGNQPA